MSTIFSFQNFPWVDVTRGLRGFRGVSGGLLAEEFDATHAIINGRMGSEHALGPCFPLLDRLDDIHMRRGPPSRTS